MPALPYVELVARLADIAANATNGLNASPVAADKSPPPPTGPLSSTPSAPLPIPHDLTTVLQVSEQALIIFAAYIMMQGIFLGMSIIFLYQAIELYKPRRSWLTFANIVQLLLWIARTLIIIVFNIAPYFMVDCTWRQYAAGFVSQCVILCVWWLQYIKFQSMYKNRPWVCRAVLAACIVCTAATFPYIATTLALPSLDHCSVTFNRDFQSAYIAADVFINILLSGLFAAAIIKHVNNTDKTWDSYSKLSYILSCDVRGSFLDTAAQLVKLFLQLAVWLPSSQTQFGSHVCDFIKVLSAHWFVNDVVKNMGETGSGTSLSTRKGGNQDGSMRGGGQGGQAAILASCRRKGSFGTKVSQYFKGDVDVGTESGTVGSTNTLKFIATSQDSLSVKQGSALKPSGKSADSLRAGSASGNLGMRGARSSDNVTMFPKREGRQL